MVKDEKGAFLGFGKKNEKEHKGLLLDQGKGGVKEVVLV